MTKIFINPGHGWPDPGAVNDNWGITEADIVRSIGDLLQNELEEMGYEVEIEQSDNLAGETSSNGEYQNYYDSVCCHANEWGADYFISLHCNAANESATGTEVWFAGYVGSRLAQSIQRELVDELESNDRGVKCDDRGLIVLQKTSMPAVLVEIEFIDTDKGAQVLVLRQKDIARAIAKGVREYVR